MGALQAHRQCPAAILEAAMRSRLTISDFICIHRGAEREGA